MVSVVFKVRLQAAAESLRAREIADIQEEINENVDSNSVTDALNEDGTE